MSAMTPKQVVEAYNYELWNKQNWTIGEQIISDQIVRHYPGSVVTLSRTEAIRRVKDTYRNRFPKMEFRLPMLLEDGEFVTLVWEMHGEDLEANETVFGGIEIFRVVDGRICEVWNDLNEHPAYGEWR